MKHVLRPLAGLLLSGAFVVLGPAGGTAQAAEGGSFSLSVNPVGTVEPATGLVEVTVTYSCTVPSGYVYDQSEVDLYLSTRDGQFDAYLYFIDGMTCDGQNRIGTAWGYNLGPRSTPRKTTYSGGGGYVGFSNAEGDYVQLDYGPLSGSVRLRLVH